MKGVSCIKGKNGTTYWYAMVDGRRVYCGKNDRGHKLAVKARQKYEVRGLVLPSSVLQRRESFRRHPMFSSLSLPLTPELNGCTND